MIDRAQNDISALEAAAVSARSGFACIFSTSEEYEQALIAERRLQGRYQQTRESHSMLLLGCVFILSGILLVAL